MFASVVVAFDLGVALAHAAGAESSESSSSRGSLGMRSILAWNARARVREKRLKTGEKVSLETAKLVAHSLWPRWPFALLAERESEGERESGREKLAPDLANWLTG